MKNPFQKKSAAAGDDLGSVPPDPTSPNAGSEPRDGVGKNPGTAEGSDDPKVSAGTKKTLLAVGAAAILAVSGVLMLVSYVRNTQETASVEDVIPEQQVLMTSGAIPAGTTLDELRSENFSRFRVERVPLSLVSEGTLASIEDLDGLGDMMAEIAIAEGEIVRGDRFVSTTSFSTRSSPVDVPPGHHQASFRLNPERLLGGLIRPGDDVSVSASFSASEGFPNMAVVILRSIEVMNVQADDAQIGNEAADGRNSVGVAPSSEYLVTVAVTADELAKLNYAMDFGRLMVASASDSPETDVLAVESLTSIVEDSGARIDSVSGQLTIDEVPAAVAFSDSSRRNSDLGASPALDVSALDVSALDADGQSSVGSSESGE